jgi:hypothetical protein
VSPAKPSSLSKGPRIPQNFKEDFNSRRILEYKDNEPQSIFSGGFV